MNDEYEGKRQMFHHYMGNELSGLKDSLQKRGAPYVQERIGGLTQKLRALGDFDLATQCLGLIGSSDFSTIEGITAFREKYDTLITNLDPKHVEFVQTLARLKSQRGQPSPE